MIDTFQSTGVTWDVLVRSPLTRPLRRTLYHQNLNGLSGFTGNRIQPSFSNHSHLPDMGGPPPCTFICSIPRHCESLEKLSQWGTLARAFVVVPKIKSALYPKDKRFTIAGVERPPHWHDQRSKIKETVLRSLIRIEDSVVIEGNTLHHLICDARSGWTEMPFLCVLVAMRWQQPSCCYSSA